MARTDTLGHFLTDIANKIRNKNSSQASITASNFDTEIEKIAFTPKAIVMFNENPLSLSTSTLRQDNTTTEVNIKNLDTSQMKYFDFMFVYLKAITSLDLRSFDTSNATTMYSTFYGCSSLTSIDVSSFDTSNVTNMTFMFRGCTVIPSIDVSSFDTSNVTNFTGMFQACKGLETITFGNNFTLGSATNLTQMFYNSTKLDNNTLNAILHICTTVTSTYTGAKTLAQLGIYDNFDNYANIPNLSNYQEFLDAGWTIS